MADTAPSRANHSSCGRRGKFRSTAVAMHDSTRFGCGVRVEDLASPALSSPDEDRNQILRARENERVGFIGVGVFQAARGLSFARWTAAAARPETRMAANLRPRLSHRKG